jgi:hypothetical protein
MSPFATDLQQNRMKWSDAGLTNLRFYFDRRDYPWNHRSFDDNTSTTEYNAPHFKL